MCLERCISLVYGVAGGTLGLGGLYVSMVMIGVVLKSAKDAIIEAAEITTAITTLSVAVTYICPKVIKWVGRYWNRKPVVLASTVVVPNSEVEHTPERQKGMYMDTRRIVKRT